MENFSIHREQVKRNITENIVGNDINKGVISDAFGYGDEITYPKTGKEMKEKLEQVLTSKATILSGLVAKMQYLSGYVGSTPSSTTPSYWMHNAEEVSKMCTGLDMVYHNKMTFLDSDQDASLVPRGFKTPDPDSAPSKDIADACRDYNDMVNKCCEICKDISYAKTMYDNIEEKKTYPLTISQLRALNC